MNLYKTLPKLTREDLGEDYINLTTGLDKKFELPDIYDFSKSPYSILRQAILQQIIGIVERNNREGDEKLDKLCKLAALVSQQEVYDIIGELGDDISIPIEMSKLKYLLKIKSLKELQETIEKYLKPTK